MSRADEQSHVDRWKEGDHVEFETDRQTDKGPCTGTVRWILDGLACLSVSDDYLHVYQRSLRVDRVSVNEQTGHPIWIFK